MFSISLYTDYITNNFTRVLLGNMGGLFNDLLSGLSVGLDGDVSGMVKSVAHGMSDTASKLSSTASTVLTYVSGDDVFRADRDRLRASR